MVEFTHFRFGASKSFDQVNWLDLTLLKSIYGEFEFEKKMNFVE